MVPLNRQLDKGELAMFESLLNKKITVLTTLEDSLIWSTLLVLPHENAYMTLTTNTCNVEVEYILPQWLPNQTSEQVSFWLLWQKKKFIAESAQRDKLLKPSFSLYIYYLCILDDNRLRHAQTKIHKSNFLDSQTTQTDSHADVSVISSLVLT